MLTRLVNLFIDSPNIKLYHFVVFYSQLVHTNKPGHCFIWSHMNNILELFRIITFYRIFEIQNIRKLKILQVKFILFSLLFPFLSNSRVKNGI